MYLVPACVVSFGLVCSLHPRVPVSHPCRVLPVMSELKTVYFKFTPRLHVPVPPRCVYRDNILGNTLITAHYESLVKQWKIVNSSFIKNCPNINSH